MNGMAAIRKAQRGDFRGQENAESSVQNTARASERAGINEARPERARDICAGDPLTQK
jgi:hypothetical protein